MALIYPTEAWQRFGPAPTVSDATGKVHHKICACDPLTGEIIGICWTWPWLHGVLYRYLAPAWARFIGEPLRKRWGIWTYTTASIGCHYFAPAPLTITPREGA